MSDQPKAAQGSAATANAPVPFRRMNIWQKGLHILKVAVFFASFGFAYPNILLD